MNESEVIGNKAISISLWKILYIVIKRLFDIVCSLIGCVLLIPITIFVKISYMLTGDFHTIFYSHERIGKNGKLFKLYKFRTMVPNADDVLKELLKDPKVEKKYNVNKKLKNDPRITKMGKYVRKFSIDETPQFINILLGHMAMIGNRPYLPREKKDMGKYYAEIVMSKPGLTGYWQTAGRNNVDFNSRLKLESYYSKHMSLWFDIKIFFKTFGVVLFGRGAN